MTETQFFFYLFALCWGACVLLSNSKGLLYKIVDGLFWTIFSIILAALAMGVGSALGGAIG